MHLAPSPPWPDSPLLRDWGTAEASPLAGALEARLQAGQPVSDFITANPFDHGFRFDAGLLADVYKEAVRAASRYSADPLGRLSAREAVASVYGKPVSPDSIMLTPGTSMAYFYLFRLLARDNGEILCPAPTYPLFDDLARIAGLRVRRYHLHKTTSPDKPVRWAADPDELSFQITPHTRAIVLVSPHNPTGTVINASEMTDICVAAAKARIPLILDEVFRTYVREESTPVPRPSDFGAELSVTLNGLSKSHYLPGIKAGWMVVEGNKAVTRPVLNALEYMSDSFLPVQDQTQAALPALVGTAGLAEAHRLGQMQRTRLQEKLTLLQKQGWNPDLPEAGPYICTALENESPGFDERLADDFLKEHGAHFHPGSHYNFPQNYLVATLFNQAEWPSPVWSPRLPR